MRGGGFDAPPSTRASIGANLATMNANLHALDGYVETPPSGGAGGGM